MNAEPPPIRREPDDELEERHLLAGLRKALPPPEP